MPFLTEAERELVGCPTSEQMEVCLRRKYLALCSLLWIAISNLKPFSNLRSPLKQGRSVSCSSASELDNSLMGRVFPGTGLKGCRRGCKIKTRTHTLARSVAETWGSQHSTLGPGAVGLAKLSPAPGVSHGSRVGSQPASQWDAGRPGSTSVRSSGAQVKLPVDLRCERKAEEKPKP